MNEKVKQALENVKTIRFYVGACSEQVCEYFKQVEETLNDFDKYCESQQDLIKGKDEYIAKLIDENKKLKDQYKNIHNTKVKVPLCNILNGLSQKERHRVIEDIYYSQAERQDFYDNKIAKLEKENKTQENELKELKEFARIVVEKSVDIDILKSYINCDKLNGKDFDYSKYKTYNYAIFSKQKLTQAEFDLIKMVVEKYGKN